MKGRWRGIRRLFSLGLWGPGVDEGVSWEIEHHIQERADELEAEGLSRAEAEREARRQFGDVAAIRRELELEGRSRERRHRVGAWLETVWQDIRYGLRGVRRNPGFAGTLVVTLGLGMGALLAAFGLVDALLLRPLPYADPGELVEVQVQYGDRGWRTGWLPQEVVWAWHDGAEDAGRLLPNRRSSMLYTGGEPRDVIVHGVAHTFEEVLGVQPALGRGFLPEDAVAGGEPVVLLSHGFWATELGGDPGVLGDRLELNGRPYTVIGVMPRGFKFPLYATTEAWRPLGDSPVAGGRIEMLARIPDARAAARARSRGAALFDELADGDTVSIVLTPLQEQRGGGDELRQAAWLLFGAMGLILLVAVVNGANLLLVRTASRGREVAVRRAVGASRGRVVRQLMTETLALAAGAGVVAVAAAWLALRAAGGRLPGGLAFWLPHDLALEHRALLLAFAVTMTVGVVLGLFPALRATGRSRARPREGLKSSTGQSSARSRVRRGLVVVEVALSVLLLAGAGLLLNSFVRLAHVDVGVEIEELALIQLPLSAQAQPDSAARATFLPRLVDRLRRIPGVEAATAMDALPSGRLRVGVELQVEGSPPAGGDPDILPSANVPPDFFEVTGARLLAGRPFRSEERPGSVAIIDEHMARHLFPGGDAVGRRFRTGSGSPWLTVVGVVEDLQLGRRDDAWGDFEMLEPFDGTETNGMVTVAVRTAGDPGPLLPTFRTAIRELAPNQPIEEMARAEAAYGEVLQLPRFLAVLVAGVAGLALLLTAIGLFGLLAYEVAQRRKEIGIRASMGATAGELRWLVVREGVVLGGIGMGLGLAAALAAGRFIRSLLYGIEPADPTTLAAVLATVLVTAALATYIPARRATRVDPAEVLRVE